VGVSDFDQVAGKITQLGGKVALYKFAVPGVCWQGYSLDPEGNFRHLPAGPKGEVATLTIIPFSKLN
jgi:predicted enzyme related to lactoylglutathione lyase